MNRRMFAIGGALLLAAAGANLVWQRIEPVVVATNPATEQIGRAHV